MKENWKIKKLGEVCEVIAGQSPEGKYYNNIGEGLPFYQGKKEFTDKYIGKPATWTTSITKEAQKDDILMSVRAPVGPVNFSTERICIGRGLAAIRPSKLIDKEFLFNFLLKHGTEIVSNTGAVFDSINKTQIKDILIPFPCLSEQQRIVSILDETFASIDKAKEIAEKNLQNSREIFESNLQSIFTDKNKGWLEKTVEELVNEGALFKPQDGNHGEIHPKKSDYVETGVPFIMAADLKDGSVDFRGCKFISRSLADSLRTGFAYNGDILLSHKATIGRAAILRTDDDYVMLTPQVTYYRIKDENRLFNKFIYFYFLSPQFQCEILDYAGSGSTRAYIGITRQLKLSFLLPPLLEQHSIVAKLEALSNETKRLEEIYQQKLAALDELKKSVLQKAFNGGLTGA